MNDSQKLAAIENHWSFCDANDQDAVHEIYHDDVVVDWPQSGERVLGKINLQTLRVNHPSRTRFSTRRILGSGDLWITEYVITYDERPVHTVSIMEWRDDKVARETHYFADPFDPPKWRAQWVAGPERHET